VTDATDVLLVDRSEGVATLTLNRPESMNSLSVALKEALLAATREVAADPAVRAVVLTGTGRGFCVGQDLREHVALLEANDPSPLSTVTEHYNPLVLALASMPKPVIAAVNGPAVGIGCSLALASDLILAAESAYFLLAFVNIGLVPDGGSSVFVPVRVGHTRAAEMAMLGERIGASQALQWGLINRVLADDELRPGAEELLERMAAGPTRSYAGTKRQLNQFIYPGLEDQLEVEAEIQQEQAATKDFAEGVTAFVQRRPPRFQGA
jgi:2-(1,2-epoxy-1,2-dihydrophenyl)acetyl-CoA isomerase